MSFNLIQSSSDAQIQSQIVRVFDGVGSLGSIYICQTSMSREFQKLKQKSINAVITAQKDQIINFPKNIISQHIYLPIQDNIDFNISIYFQETYKFIEQNRINTNILIHCSTSLQCSVALICSYFIKKYKYTYLQAIDLIKRKYSKFQKQFKNFNSGFAHQLQYFAVQNGDFNKIQVNHLKKKNLRIKNTYEGISRSYSKELTKEQKLVGINKNIKRNSMERIQSNSLMNSLKSISFIPSGNSPNKKNPENTEYFHQTSFFVNNREISQQYLKYIPKISQEQQQDFQHHKKMVQQIFLLNQQSKIYSSTRIQKLKQNDNNPIKNYQRLKQSKKKHLVFYSPLKKYQKYVMFSTKKFNKQLQLFDIKSKEIN